MSRILRELFYIIFHNIILDFVITTMVFRLSALVIIELAGVNLSLVEPGVYIVGRIIFFLRINLIKFPLAI